MSRVLITGAASGLGWAMAQVFFARGDQLLLVDRDQALLQERATALADPARITVVVADLNTENGVQSVIDATIAEHHVLDILINNAGITHRSAARLTDPAVFRRVMNVDWQAPAELAVGLLPSLRRGEGAIINIGSMAGWMPVPGRAAYCSAKSALTQFFEVLRVEEAEHGIHVLMVYPSFLDTPIEKNALGKDGRPATHARSTVGRIDSADELARNIVVALGKKKRWLYPNRATWLASLLWRLAPGLFHRGIRRKFASELEVL